MTRHDASVSLLWRLLPLMPPQQIPWRNRLLLLRQLRQLILLGLSQQWPRCRPRHLHLPCLPSWVGGILVLVASDSHLLSAHSTGRSRLGSGFGVSMSTSSPADFGSNWHCSCAASPPVHCWPIRAVVGWKRYAKGLLVS